MDDAQLSVYEDVVDALASHKKGEVFVVMGGPGTGKSLIACKLLAYGLTNSIPTLYLVQSKMLKATLSKTFACAQDNFQYPDYFSEHPDSHCQLTLVDETQRINDRSLIADIANILMSLCFSSIQSNAWIKKASRIEKASSHRCPIPVLLI